MAANGVLTIVKETAAPVKAALASLGGHHWTGQAIVLLVLLPLLAALFQGIGLGTKVAPHPCRIGMTIMFGAVSSLLLIAGFYILE